MNDTINDPSDRLTSKQVAEMYSISNSTLGNWRIYRRYDNKYPRFHKLITGRVYYIRHEIEEDMAAMEQTICQMGVS